MPIVATNIDPVRAGSTTDPTWQEALRNAVRTPQELCEMLHLPTTFKSAALAGAKGFPLFAPREYIARMRVGDVDDPLLRQVLPIRDELDDVPGFVTDPVGDVNAAMTPTLLKKYHGRALLVTTGACAIHCRYCFRRHYDYEQSPPSLAVWDEAIELLAADESIDEVLLSGGDPLTIADSQLRLLVERLASIPHLRRLRVHSRLPIVIPQRVTTELIDVLTSTRLQPIMVVHANHANEFGDGVGAALRRLTTAAIMMFNQSVLLRGVNDSTGALIDLSQRLIDHQVTPYYLHELDRVAGAAHFAVPRHHGIALIEEMRTRLPGYAVPRYVREVAGESNKQVMA